MEYIQENEFKEAVLSNNLETVERLIGKGLDPSLWDNYAIKWASIRGYTKMVKRLLLDSRIDPDDWVMFEEVCERGHLEVVKSLLLDYRVGRDIIMANFGSPLHAAAMRCHSDIVKALLASPTVQFSEFDYQGMQIIFRYTSIEVCELFVKDDRWHDPGFDRETDFQEFPYSEHPEASRVLLDNNAVKATDEITRACENVDLDRSRKFQVAVMKGNLEEVKDMIQHNNIDPSLGTPFGNWALSIASERGHLDLVKYLLTDQRVGMGLGPKWAASSGHLEVVKVLLNDKRSTGDDVVQCIKTACTYGYTTMLEYLLQDSRVSADLTSLIYNRASFDVFNTGHNAIIDRLLRDGRVFPKNGQWLDRDLKLLHDIYEQPGAIAILMRYKNAEKRILLETLSLPDNDDILFEVKYLLREWRVYICELLNLNQSSGKLYEYKIPDSIMMLIVEYLDGPYGATKTEMGRLADFFYSRIKNRKSSSAIITRTNI
jgi:hypothetical protein